MEIFASLVLILLTLFGYSSGAALAHPKKRLTPRLLDLVLAFLLCVGAIATRGLLGRWWNILIWILASLVVGLVVSKLRKDTATLPDLAPVQGDGTSYWRGLWKRWLHFSHRTSNYQSRLLLAGLYFTLVLPFGIITRLFVDPLNIRQPRAESGWRAWEAPEANLETSRRQF